MRAEASLPEPIFLLFPGEAPSRLARIMAQYKVKDCNDKCVFEIDAADVGVSEGFFVFVDEDEATIAMWPAYPPGAAGKATSGTGTGTDPYHIIRL